MDPALQDRSPRTIDRFAAGNLVEIHAIRGDRQLCRRMESMGLLPGKQVTILRKVYPSFAEVVFPDGSMQPVK